MQDKIYPEYHFSERLAALRTQANVSAREMSLSLGQNGSYINRIENHHALPSMNLFFYICEYLEITPKDFFDTELSNPKLINEITEELKNLDETQLNTILAVAKGLNHK